MSEEYGARWLSRTTSLGGVGLEIEAARRLLTLAVAAVNAQEGSLLIWDEEINELRFVATVGNEDSETALRGQRVPLGQGVTGLAAVTREVQVGAPTYKDIQQTERLAGGPEAVVAAPLLIGDRLLGVMTGVTFQLAQRFGREEATAYGQFAAVMAVLLEQGRRLVAVVESEIGTGATPSGAIALEREVIERLARIVGNNADVLGPVARLCEAIEALIQARYHR
jgi:hypothetical protein